VGNDPATDPGTHWNIIAQIGATGPTGPTGATGPQGPAGPTAVSTNANNKATLGSDSLLLVQGTAAGVAATTHAQTVSGDDPQLTNTRVPTTHGLTHAGNGSDPVPVATTTVAGLVPAKPNAGVNATTTQVVMGDDTRLTNSRMPTAHATTHQAGGSDTIALDTLAAPTDNTTLNASTSAHGLMPKATGSASTFYGSDATQKAVPYSSLSGTPSTFAPSAHETSHVTGSDQIPLASASTKGLLNQTSGNTTDFIDGTNNSHPLNQPVLLGETAADSTFTSGIIVPRYKTHPDAIWTPYGVFDDHFDNPVSGTPNAKWVQSNTSGMVSLTTTQAGSKLCIGGASPAATTAYYQNLATQQLPAQINHTVTFKAEYFGLALNAATTASSSGVIFSLAYGSNAGGVNVFIYSFKSPSFASTYLDINYGANYGSYIEYVLMGCPAYFRFAYTTTNTIISLSFDGITWFPIATITAAQSGFGTNVPTQFILGVQVNNQSLAWAQVDWIKHV
jgi:hypothetical protein